MRIELKRTKSTFSSEDWLAGCNLVIHTSHGIVMYLLSQHDEVIVVRPELTGGRLFFIVTPPS
jgi:hypothetical protein